MAVETTSTLNTTPFVLRGLPEALERSDATLLTDATRTEDLVQYTVLGKVAATGKYVPLTTVTATDGSAIPAAIYLGSDIAAADIAAGDVTGLHILEGDALCDEGKLVLENSLTLATAWASSDATNVYDTMTIRDLFKRIGIVFNDVDYIEPA